MKKCSRLCKEAGTRNWISRVAGSLQAARSCTRAKHAEKMNCHTSYSTIGQKVQSGHSVTSRLELAAQLSREAKSSANSVLKKLTLRIPLSPQYIYPLYPRNVESFQREIERATLEKNKIDSSPIFTQRLFKFLYSHPLHCYILERFITKIFSHHTHICEKAI